MYVDFMTMMSDIKEHIKVNSSVTIEPYNEMIPTESFGYENEEEFKKALASNEIKFDVQFGYKASDGTIWQIPIKNIKDNATPTLIIEALRSSEGQKALIESLYTKES